MNKQSKRPERFVLRMTREEKKRLEEVSKGIDAGAGFILRACINKLWNDLYLSKAEKEDN